MPQKKVPNKPVQISLAPTLLRDKERERVDGQFQAALQGREAELFCEVEPFLGGQAWPA